MPKQSKRLLAALLAVVMLCSLLPVTALAEEPAVEELPIVEETPAEETPVEEAEAAPVESDTPEQEAAADEPAAEAELVIEDVSEAAAYNAEGSLTLGEPMTITLTAGYHSYSFTAAVKGTYTFKGYDYDYANVDIRGFLYSDADCTNMVASCTEYDVGQYFDATYTMEAGQTVYWELNETERRTCQITLLVTLPVKDPVALYQDEPGITTIDSNGVVYAFEPCVSGNHTFRIYSNAPMSGVLYSNAGLTNDLAIGNRDDNNGTYVLTAELSLGTTYYLKVSPSEAGSDMSCAVVVSDDIESNLNNGSWILGTGSPWYLDAEYKLHGSSVLYNTEQELTLTEGEDYQLEWYWADGTYHKDSSGLPRAGLYALVAKATENSGRSGALVSYVTVLQVNNLGSCEFAETNPIIADGKLIALEDVIWLGDGSTVPASAYTLTWYSKVDGQLVAMEAAPTEAGEYCLKATPAEGSGWSGSLEREYVIRSYTSTSLSAGSNTVSFTDDDIVYAFTPEKSGTYRFTVQAIGTAGYFKLSPIGERYDFNSDSPVRSSYTLTAGTTYYLYVDNFNNGRADLSIDIDEYVKPGGALTLGEARSADIPKNESAEFTFTAPEDGTYDISVKGTAQEGSYSFDNENWYAYGTEAYDTQRIDLEKDEAVTLYVQSEAEDSVTALVEQYIKPGGALTLGEARSADIPKNESAEFTFTAPEDGTYDFYITGSSCAAWYSFDGNNWSNYGTDRKALEKDEAVTLYVNSEAANTVTVLVEKYVKPGGTLTLGEALSIAIPAHEIAEFPFTAPADGTYSISLMGTDCPGWYSFDNEAWWTYSAEEYDTENWDLAEGETLTVYVAPDAADTVTVLVKEYKGNAIQIAEPGDPGSDEETPIVLRGGTSLKLTATITDPELKGQAILWDMGSIYDTSYAAVNAKGVVSTREVPEPVPVSVKAYLKADPEVSGTVYLLLVPAVQYVSIYSETAPNNGVISVDLSGATAEAPARLQLYAAAEPSYALQTGVWKSSNAKIATVDQDGLVTFVKAGEVTITFTAADGSKKSSSVRLCGGIPVSTLTISSSVPAVDIGDMLTIFLTSGQKATLKAAVNPDATNKAVTWSSSDPDVATVSASGVVTTKTVYEARFVTITAIAKDGSGIRREAGILVTPKENVLPLYLDDMVVNGTTQTGNYLGNGKEFFLEADATTWKSSNAKIATVDDEGHVTFLKPGKVTITAKNGTRSGSVTLQSINFITGIQLRTADGKTEGDEIFLASGKGKVTLKATEAMLGGTGKAVPVIWTSDEPDVAAVNAKGVVTAKAGVYEDTFVTITATAKDGSGISQSFTLMVVPLATTVSIYSWNDLEIENAPGEVQEDELLNNRILVVDLEKQATLDLWSVAAPYSLEASALQAVTWKSSSAKVATVENGRVTLKAPGTVTISVTTADGSKKTASFKLTVVRYAKGIEPAETELALASGCKTTLKYNLVTATDAKVSDSKVLFSLVNPEDAAYVTLTDKGVITAKAVTESHTVPVRITYAANRSIYAEVNVTVGPA